MTEQPMHEIEGEDLRAFGMRMTRSTLPVNSPPILTGLVRIHPLRMEASAISPSQR